jgi:hypothetical protein
MAISDFTMPAIGQAPARHSLLLRRNDKQETELLRMLA